MNLYKISQEINNNHDTFDSAIVAAIDENDARNIHPVLDWLVGDVLQEWKDGDHCRTWVKYEQIGNISVEYIGTTELPRGVILSSFNAG